MPKPAVICLTAGAVPVAQRVVTLLDGTLHGKADRVLEAEVPFTETVAHLAELFREGTPIIGVCAAGILIRAVAPELKDKRTEPPVLAVAENGSSVVPLLGGHHQANALAQQITQALGGAPAVTTSGDVRFGIALDEPPDGLTLANPEHAKTFMAELLNGATLTMEGRHPWFRESRLPRHPHGRLRISVSERCWSGSTSHLVYHPRTLALGVGCERGCDPDELWTLVDETLRWYHLAPESVAGVFSLEVKCDEQAVLSLGLRLNCPVRFFDAATLEEQKARLLTPSQVVFREVGCHGVAEGAALAVVGALGMLWVSKV
ncbi:MAG: cobalamin biosynthesis protein, partial [SAR324 cluster bacterium]|nr:cobalamin biosynthesis protein [SAR324 cluster bacterium]